MALNLLLCVGHTMTIGRFYASAAAMAAALGGFSLPVTVLLAAAGKVEVEVTGAITPYCANSVTAVPINLTDPRKAGSAKFAFTIDCNAPFRYTMRSDNGALRLADAPAALSSHQIEVAYDVRIRISLNHGTVIDDTCSSKSIKHGAINCDFTDLAPRQRSSSTLKHRSPGTTPISLCWQGSTLTA